MSMALILLAGALAACADDSNGGAETVGATTGSTTTAVAKVDDVCTAARVGGTLTIGAWVETGALDPVAIVGGTSGGPEAAAIFDTLMRFNPTTQANEPWVAESLTPNADRTQWTLRLRTGVKFGNGDVLTAAAVKASIERHQNPANRSRFSDLVAPIAAMEVKDDLTVVFTMKGPDTTLPNVLTDAPGMITNPNVVTALGEKFKTLPVGAGVGPYEPVKFTPLEEIVMKARADYWGGPVCIQEIRFKPASNDDTRMRMYSNGDFGLTWLRDPIARANIASVPHQDDPAFRLVRNSGGILAINNTREPFTDLKVRQALTLAIDANVVTERGFQGKARPSKALIDTKSALFTPGMQPQGFDLTRAQALVNELKAAGTSTSYDMICPSSAADYGLAVKTLLDRAGFSINLDATVAVGPFVQKVNVERNYQLACQGLNIDDASPWIGFGRFLGGGSGANFLNYKNADMDRAIAGMKNTTNVDELKRYVADAQKVFNETFPAAALFPAEQLTIVSPKLHGVVPTGGSIVLLGKAYLTNS
jgi:peptide/nickel transport system substrate-binding protein